MSNYTDKLVMDAIENIQRYYIHSSSDSHGSCWLAEADSDGEWVKWSDLEAAISQRGKVSLRGRTG